MKIAVIANGPGVEYSVAKSSCQDGYLLIVDVETMSCTVMQNPMRAAGGPAAGKLFARVLNENNVWAILVQNGEFKMLKELAYAQIQILVGMTGPVQKVVEEFRDTFCSVEV